MEPNMVYSDRPMQRPVQRPYTTLLHHNIAQVNKHLATSAHRNKKNRRAGIALPSGVTNRLQAFDAALSIWSVGPDPLVVSNTIRDTVFTLWDACNPGMGNKFFVQQSKWQPFVAFLFMILDNARNGRRLDQCVRVCKCEWEQIEGLAPIQSIPVRLCNRSGWYTSRQVKFMSILDEISGGETDALDCIHCQAC
jgi:hypothetical protein